MEETLYNIEIHKDDSGFMGKLFSDVDGVKEFNYKEYIGTDETGKGEH